MSILWNIISKLKQKNILKITLPIFSLVVAVFGSVMLFNILKEESMASPVLVTEEFAEVVFLETELVTEDLDKEKYVAMSVETAQNDLRIKFYDRNLELYTGVNFEVTVTKMGGEPTSYIDEDADGRIYLDSISAGDYTVEMVIPEEFTCLSDVINVTVKDKVAYKPLEDIKEDVKQESDIDTSKEETVKKDTVQEVVLKDTVEFVKSTETKHLNYVVVPFDDIVDPNVVETITETTTILSDISDVSSDTGTMTSVPETTTQVVEEITTAVAETTVPGTTISAPTVLKDSEGNKLYIKEGEEYILAYASDYTDTDTFYKLVITYTYTGWQKIDGSTYYFDKNGNAVTGEQIIGGAKYDFGKSGALKTGSGILGIDVSKYQGDIDWQAVKASGVQFVIIRCAYRGYGTGVLVEDVNFKKNIEGASKAGIDIGIYIFSQAINEVEAVEEASACIQYVKGYTIKYPMFIDIETSGGNGSGRADGLSNTQRTNVAVAFCETIRNAGYKPGVYANKNYLTNKMDASKLSKYYIWLAQYAEKPTYSGEYDMWQYTSKGQVSGINGNVDMNLSYIF